jgi:hypothetical protein
MNIHPSKLQALVEDRNHTIALQSRQARGSQAVKVAAEWLAVVGQIAGVIRLWRQGGSECIPLWLCAALKATGTVLLSH